MVEAKEATDEEKSPLEKAKDMAENVFIGIFIWLFGTFWLAGIRKDNSISSGDAYTRSELISELVFIGILLPVTWGLGYVVYRALVKTFYRLNIRKAFTRVK